MKATKELEFEQLCDLAYRSNHLLWNCVMDFSSDGLGTTELDMYVKFGKRGSDYQIGHPRRQRTGRMVQIGEMYIQSIIN